MIKKTPGGIWYKTDEPEPVDPNEARLAARYETDKEFRDLADEIHSSRMMTPPACIQCMQIAEERIKARASKSTLRDCRFRPKDPQSKISDPACSSASRQTSDEPQMPVEASVPAPTEADLQPVDQPQS